MPMRKMSIYPVTNILQTVHDRMPGKRTDEMGHKEKAGVSEEVESIQGTPFGFFKRFSSEWVAKRFENKSIARIWAAQHGYVLDGELSEEFYERINKFNT